jgi:hypothetical protein
MAAVRWILLKANAAIRCIHFKGVMAAFVATIMKV